MQASPTRLAGPIVAHAIVDFFSFLLLPLLTIVEGRFALSHEQGALLLALGSISSGTVQPIIAYLSDRHDTRRLGSLGFLVAVIAISSFGWVTQFWHLVILQILGTAGIGAFHPVAAAAVGHLSGQRRSLGVALFFAAGMIGGMAGNYVAPPWVRTFEDSAATPGLRSLLWFAPIGCLGIAYLAWAVHAVPHRRHDAHAEHAALPKKERGRRWAAIGFLYVGAVVRFTAEMAMITLIVRWTERLAASADSLPAEFLTDAARQHAAALNGPLQAAKQIGMGIAGLAVGYFLRVRHERALLVALPLVGAAALVALPHTTGWYAWLFAVLAGAGIGGGQPLSISLAQRILPHRTGLASGLMMGGAWALAAVGPAMAQMLLAGFGMNIAFALTGAILIVASASSLAIPSALIHATSDEHSSRRSGSPIKP